jgi:hypothetical protein
LIILCFTLRLLGSLSLTTGPFNRFLQRDLSVPFGTVRLAP